MLVDLLVGTGTGPTLRGGGTSRHQTRRRRNVRAGTPSVTHKWHPFSVCRTRHTGGRGIPTLPALFAPLFFVNHSSVSRSRWFSSMCCSICSESSAGSGCPTRAPCRGGQRRRGVGRPCARRAGARPPSRCAEGRCRRRRSARTRRPSPRAASSVSAGLDAPTRPAPAPAPRFCRWSTLVMCVSCASCLTSCESSWFLRRCSLSCVCICWALSRATPRPSPPWRALQLALELLDHPTIRSRC